MVKGTHRRSNGDVAPTKPSTGSSEDVIGHWLKLYQAMYRQEISEELSEAYRIGLAELKQPALLQRALERTLKTAKYFPTVAEIREAYELECDKPGTGSSYKHTAVPAKDPETGRPVIAWLYDDDPKPELHYRAEDCPEGRAFLALLRKLKLAHQKSK